jgi:hypothetical protein
MRLPTIELDAVNADLASLMGQVRPEIDQCLLKYGYAHIHGLAIDSAQGFEAICGLLFSSLISDNGEHTRNQLSAYVYSPVAYSPRSRLLWHNENSFNLSWPRKIAFACLTQATQGGEAVLADSRKVFASLRRDVRTRFLEKQVMYTRRYNQGVGKDWISVFQSRTREEAEQRMREQSLRFSWEPDGTLETAAVRPAAIRHPQTREPHGSHKSSTGTPRVWIAPPERPLNRSFHPKRCQETVITATEKESTTEPLRNSVRLTKKWK